MNAYAQIMHDYHFTQSHMIFKSDFTGINMDLNRYIMLFDLVKKLPSAVPFGIGIPISFYLIGKRDFGF
jgi:hypothetical protein